MQVVTKTKYRGGTYPPGHIMSVIVIVISVSLVKSVLLTLELKTKNNKKRLEKRQGYSACDCYNSLILL